MYTGSGCSIPATLINLKISRYFKMAQCLFRILRLKAGGLLEEWEKWYVPTPSKCLDRNQRVRNQRLSTKHLNSAIVILITGCALSTVVCVIEKLYFLRSCRVWVNLFIIAKTNDMLMILRNSLVYVYEP